MGSAQGDLALGLEQGFPAIGLQAPMPRRAGGLSIAVWCVLPLGAAHQADLLPKACSNSPDSYISIMMSDPPMNSPLM